MRESFFKTGKIISPYKLFGQLAKENQVDYRALPVQTSQQTILLLEKNWKSFFKLIKDWGKNPNKYKGKPKPPKYKHKKKGRNIVVFTNQQAKLKDGYVHFPQRAELKPVKTNVDNINQVRIIPEGSHYTIEVVYEKEKQTPDLDESLYLSIDLGVNNLVSTSNNAGLRPFIINGSTIKSFNQFYNKEKARLQAFIGDKGISNAIHRLTRKRNNKITDAIHKSTRYVIDYCVHHKIKNIVVGYNEGWKDEINIGRVNNQKFVCVPYLKLVRQLEYKAEEAGIVVKRQEEAYTSKCSALDLEPIKKQKKYLGKRVKRGLFKTGDGTLVNADAGNASLNILRKVIGDGFISLLDRGLVLNPFKVNIYCNDKFTQFNKV
jgi:putative transposase